MHFHFNSDQSKELSQDCENDESAVAAKNSFVWYARSCSDRLSFSKPLYLAALSIM